MIICCTFKNHTTPQMQFNVIKMLWVLGSACWEDADCNAFYVVTLTSFLEQIIATGQHCVHSYLMPYINKSTGCETWHLNQHIMYNLIFYSILFFFIVGPLSRSPCELLPVGMGHPVQVMLKSFTALSGCASRGTTSLPQEVHIINLRGHAPEGPDNTPAEVSHP